MTNCSKIGVMAVAIALLAGCDGRQALAERAVRSALKDPDSAQFGPIAVYGTKENLLACGTVNAKNSFGGYVGGHPFMISQGLVYLGTDETANSVSLCCHSMLRESLEEDGKPVSLETAEICSKRGEAVTVLSLL